MKRNISLYIAGHKVDLDDNSLILFNYSIGDLDNPIIIKNSYSRNIVLKGTKVNNKLFGAIFRLDRRAIYSDEYTGVNFDPMRKTPFEIYDETNTCLESGYVKLNDISRNGAEVSYNISLYGGLGSFLYGLSYKADGSKKTLADLKWKGSNGQDVDFLLADVATKGKDYVSAAWSRLKGGSSTTYQFWDILNFAPAYNGIPKDFDANKVIVNSRFENVSLSKSDGGVTYTTKESCGVALALMENKHTEWEMRDLRWYLQRPVFSMKALVAAISDGRNNGGYSVILDDKFFSSSVYEYERLWVTLPMIATEDRASEKCLANLLKSTKSPADYLLSYIKTFNLVIMCDYKNKIIRIMTRQSFYKADEVLDITNRITSEVKIVPSAVTSRRYMLGGEVQGQFAEEYKRDYGRDYGAQRIDTGYEFNNDTHILTNDIVFNAAAEVLEKNLLFQSVLPPLKTGIKYPTFIYPAFESVNLELWTQGDEAKSKKFPLYATIKELVIRDLQGNIVESNITYFNDEKYGDAFSKIQLHGAENQPIDGDGVLVYYARSEDTSFYRLTNDHPKLELLNSGVPCWDLTETDKNMSIPRFERQAVIEGLVNYFFAFRESLEWGVPSIYGKSFGSNVQVPIDKPSIYKRFWMNYLTDLYDDDTRVMTCKVNLRGLQVNDNLLGKFFWFENSYWVLNKISNYSITTFDDAECEFVKVQDIKNYTE